MPAAPVKESPLLMTGEMVRPTLIDLKTQTRRVVKPQPPDGTTSAGVISGGQSDGVWSWLDGEPTDAETWGVLGDDFRSPYGGPGDLLWVRETWGAWQRGDATPVHGQPYDPVVVYRADDEDPDIPHDLLWEPFRWRASIHMPKKLCRLWLTITGLRVERVQDITTEDIWAEGLQIPTSEDGGVLWRMAPANPAGKVPASYLTPGRLHPGQPPVTTDEVARAHFADLWDRLNTRRGYPWAANDWVWAIEYERTEVSS